MNSLIVPGEKLTVGFDTEHVAYMNSLASKYDHTQADVVQICPSADLCILVYFKGDEPSPYSAFQSFLADKRIVKVNYLLLLLLWSIIRFRLLYALSVTYLFGCGYLLSFQLYTYTYTMYQVGVCIAGDVKQLNQRYPQQQFEGFMDTITLAKKKVATKSYSLSSLTALPCTLHSYLNKAMDHTVWDYYPLPPLHKRYAVLDAAASLMVHLALEKLPDLRLLPAPLLPAALHPPNPDRTVTVEVRDNFV